MGSVEESWIDFRPVFNGKRIFLTGHTGFKGSWLALWLAQLNAQVTGFSLDPPTAPNNFEQSRVADRITSHLTGDIRNAAHLACALHSAQPDVVFHLAAQPIVRKGYRDPHATFDANVMGTVNLLEAVRTLDRPCAVVVVTSDKCYENQDQVWGYRECDRLGGHDPYSASKAACEIVTSSYRDSFFPPSELAQHGVQLATARAGNVFGGGDWAEDRIVVDIQRALHQGTPIELRNPQATRPWQHVLEPLGGYCQLAAAMLAAPSARWSSAWNFGPTSDKEQSVADLTDACIDAWGGGQWLDTSEHTQPHEANLLRLSIDKATSTLHWSPCWSFEQTVRRTVRWYQAYYEQPEHKMGPFCQADIGAYEQTFFGRHASHGARTSVSPAANRTEPRTAATLRRAG